MEAMKDALSPLVPRLKDAISSLNTEAEFADFARPFIMELARHCLPRHTVEIAEFCDPQEESKD